MLVGSSVIRAVQFDICKRKSSTHFNRCSDDTDKCKKPFIMLINEEQCSSVPSAVQNSTKTHKNLENITRFLFGGFTYFCFCFLYHFWTKTITLT